MLVDSEFRYYVKIMAIIFCAGLFATFTMDAWNGVLDLTSGVTLDWHLMGRWALDWFNGDMIFRHIAKTPALAHESVVGWVVHYATGVIYTYLYFLLIIKLFHKRNTLKHAIFFSLCFIVMPFLLYQPAMGLGYFASSTAHPDFVRLVTFSFHCAFGLGLFFASLWAQRLIQHLHKPDHNAHQEHGEGDA